MSRLGADRIVWSGNTLDELRRLLGGIPEIEFPDVDGHGLDYPWPITVKSVTYDSERTNEYVTVTLAFDEVPDATEYEVRFSLVPDTYPSITETIGLAPSWSWNSLTKPLGPDDRCIMFCADTADGPTGMFSTWTKVLTVGSGSSAHIAVWVGSGVGTGSLTVTTSVYTGFGVYGDFALGWIYRNVGDIAVMTETSNIVAPGSPISSAAITAPRGSIFASCANGKAGFLARFVPVDVDPASVTGLPNYSYIRAADLQGDLYAKGKAGVSGVVRNSSSIDVDYTMAWEPDAAGGMVRHVVFSYTGVA